MTKCLAIALLALGCIACQKEKPPVPPTSHVIPEYKSASEAIGKQIPTTEGLPGRSGVQGIQKALENTEAAQDRRERRALGAGEAQ